MNQARAINNAWTAAWQSLQKATADNPLAGEPMALGMLTELAIRMFAEQMKLYGHTPASKELAERINKRLAKSYTLYRLVRRERKVNGSGE